ncbi:bifunctional uroporphyrinogen-III synthetase/response regulator domain protein [compost metagenome]
MFTNAAQVHNLFAIAGQQNRAAALKTALDRTLVASIGPVCSDALGKFGVCAAIEPHPPKLGPLVSALAEALSR